MVRTATAAAMLGALMLAAPASGAPVSRTVSAASDVSSQSRPPRLRVYPGRMLYRDCDFRLVQVKPAGRHLHRAAATVLVGARLIALGSLRLPMRLAVFVFAVSVFAVPASAQRAPGSVDPVPGPALPPPAVTAPVAPAPPAVVAPAPAPAVTPPPPPAATTQTAPEPYASSPSTENADTPPKQEAKKPARRKQARARYHYRYGSHGPFFFAHPRFWRGFFPYRYRYYRYPRRYAYRRYYRPYYRFRW